MAFSISPTDYPLLHPLFIHACRDGRCCDCQPIRVSDRVRYLGIFLDAKLNWTYHLEFINKRLRKTIHIFKELSHILDNRSTWQAYYSLCQSLILYGIIGWGGTSTTLLDKLRTTQRLILKIILRRPRLYPTAQLFAEAKVLDVRQLYVKTALIHFKRNPQDMQRRTHGYPTRTRTSVLPPRMKKRFGQRHYLFLAPKFFNLVPDDIKIIVNNSKFKKKIHEWLLEKGGPEVERMLTVQV